MGAIVVVLAVNEQVLEKVYWLSMDKRVFPFLALVEHTNLISPEHYGGDRLLYLGDYLEPDHPAFALSDDELLDVWLPAVSKVNPSFDPGSVRKAWVFRTPYAQPVVPLGFSKHIPPLATPLPGLYLASMSQVYPWDRGTNYAVEIGRRVAATVAATVPVTPLAG
jgi:protoporphyrinogen oxidase